MKNLGIIVAMEVEAKELIEKLDLKQIDDKNNIYFKELNNKKYSVVYLIISGIGVENSAIATQILLSDYSVNKVLNFGYVGSNKLKIGKVVCVSEVYNKDFDLTCMGYKRYEIPGVKDLNLELINGYESCVCYSSNSFVTKSEENDSVVYDMELHGIAICCQKNNIPLYSLKIVTDSLDVYKYNSSEKDISFSEKISSEVIKVIN